MYSHISVKGIPRGVVVYVWDKRSRGCRFKPSLRHHWESEAVLTVKYLLLQ